MRSAADAAPSFLYIEDLAARATEFTLEGDEARYLSRVVRARDGERVTASDGEGVLAALQVVRARPHVVLRIEQRRSLPAPPSARMLCGAPEGERGDWLVEKLAELGVTDLTPVETGRAKWPAPVRVDRWKRLAVAALRQSRSAWRMRIAAPAALEAAVDALEPGVRWLADQAGAPVSSLQTTEGEAFTGAVGPSSGLSDGERKWMMECGFVGVRLAPIRLRTETAALALAALWSARRVPPAGERLADVP